MQIKSFTVSNMETNAYIVFDEENLDAVVIDPGDNPEIFIQYIKNKKLNLRYIALTHSHFDHIGGVAEIKKFTNAKVVICSGEEVIAENPIKNLSSYFHSPFTVKADLILNDGDTLSFGNLSAKIIKTPGHTPGGCCYYFENESVLFSGDTLFYSSIGRTDFPDGSYADLIESINNKLMSLSDNVIVYCGHGPKTSIGFERENNPYISKNLDLFD